MDVYLSNTTSGCFPVVQKGGAPMNVAPAEFASLICRHCITHLLHNASCLVTDQPLSQSLKRDAAIKRPIIQLGDVFALLSASSIAKAMVINVSTLQPLLDSLSIKQGESSIFQFSHASSSCKSEKIQIKTKPHDQCGMQKATYCNSRMFATSALQNEQSRV